MRKIAILLVLLFAIGLTNAQSHKSGTLSFQFGYRIGLQDTKTDFKSANTILIDAKEKALSRLTSVRVHYNLFKFLSVGVVGDYGLLVDDSSSTTFNNPLYNIGIEARIYLLNFDKFNLYGGAGLGTSVLRLNSTGGTTDLSYYLNSPGFAFQAGFNWYFLKIVGIHIQTGLSSYNYQMKKLMINEVEQDISNLDFKKAMFGFDFQVGLSLKI